MRNKLNPIVALCIMLPLYALADTTSENLTKIEAETLLLKAREKQLSVQAQIAAKRAEIASKQAETNRLARIGTYGDPVIRSVEGIGPVTYATLQMENGSTVEAKTGDILPNGMKVVSVNQNEVIVETQKKKRVRLSTGTVAAQHYGAAAGGAGAGLPPLPVMPPSAGVAR